MKLLLPSGCGNAPRIGIVADLARGWASGSPDLAAWLADEVKWYVNGRSIHSVGKGGALVRGSGEIDQLSIRSIITHGREAACEGSISSADETSNFCHIFRFSGVGRAAKVVEIRTYIS